MQAAQAAAHRWARRWRPQRAAATAGAATRPCHRCGVWTALSDRMASCDHRSRPPLKSPNSKCKRPASALAPKR
eukprot:362449-Chlamydomonas_euryale.AAC.2